MDIEADLADLKTRTIGQTWRTTDMNENESSLMKSLPTFFLNEKVNYGCGKTNDERDGSVYSLHLITSDR